MATPEPHPTSQHPLVWLTYFPVISLKTPIERADWRYAGDLNNRAALQQHLHTLADPVIVLAGHLHIRSHAIAANIL